MTAKCEEIPLPNGEIETYYYNENGQKHRTDGPAVDGPNSTEYWVNGQLHRDNGPSIVYHKGDENGVGVGQKLWHLNGVRMPEYIVTANNADFKREWYFEEKNAEVRREILRKFGIERIITIVNKKRLKIGDAVLLDKEDNNDLEYELYKVRLTQQTYGIYLKMKNPSVGVYHFEGVPNEIKTVEEAINWRNHGHGRPEFLS